MITGVERKSHVRAASSVPRTVTTLHGIDTTLLGQDPDYRTAIGDVTAAAAGLDLLVESPNLTHELVNAVAVARSDSSRQIASRRGMWRCIAV
jgi:hypothetical protein